MLILNFSHPLTADQLVQVEALTGQPVSQVLDLPTQFDNDQPFPPQVRKLVAAIGLEPQRWQSDPILVNPPSYNFGALTLLAELHGRMGYFPAILRVRPVAGSIPPRYEVAEVINLQAVRDQARHSRNGG
jgi:hypothetical protein